MSMMTSESPRTVTCSICKKTGHNRRTCRAHVKPVECRLVDPALNTRRFEPCYRFDPVCLLTEPLPVKKKFRF